MSIDGKKLAKQFEINKVKIKELYDACILAKSESDEIEKIVRARHIAILESNNFVDEQGKRVTEPDEAFIIHPQESFDLYIELIDKSNKENGFDKEKEKFDCPALIKATDLFGKQRELIRFFLGFYESDDKKAEETTKLILLFEDKTNTFIDKIGNLLKISNFNPHKQ